MTNPPKMNAYDIVNALRHDLLNTQRDRESAAAAIESLIAANRDLTDEVAFLAGWLYQMRQAARQAARQ